MQQTADQRLLTMMRTFNEIQSGPNPLTPEEVAELIVRHPHYRVLEAGATTPAAGFLEADDDSR